MSRSSAVSDEALTATSERLRDVICQRWEETQKKSNNIQLTN